MISIIEWFLDWWHETSVEVLILECRDRIQNSYCEHTFIELSNGTRGYVTGYLGKPGEKIFVRKNDIRRYTSERF